jgi:hypothetical protein
MQICRNELYVQVYPDCSAQKIKNNPPTFGGLKSIVAVTGASL